MKLATYKDGSRDGQLVVVSRDLASAHFATGTASRLQQVLDDWNYLSPQLEDLYHTLNHGKARHAFAFEPRKCMAPLPRAYQRVDGSAYSKHVERMLQAGKADLPDSLRSQPLMHQCASDDLLGPQDEAVFADEAWGIEFAAGLAVVTGDIPTGCAPDRALEGIRLLMLANDWTLRHLAADEMATGCGLLQSRPAAAFGPVAVTADELGDAWKGGRLHRVLHSALNGRSVGKAETGPGMNFHFGQLIAHAARTRPLHAGSIVGSGAVSSQGEAATACLRDGDTVRIELDGADGHSLFGAIEQRVVVESAR